MRADDRFVESLTVAMALAPGVYSRNRMFALFAQPGVQRAKFRAAALRGLVKQLKNAQGITVRSEGGAEAAGDVRHVLEFKLPELRLSRVAQLTRLELATLRVLAAQAGLPCLPPEPHDRALVDATLARLIEGAEPATTTIAQAAAGSVAPPGE
ncbi:MAG: hypothetical protein JST00_24440 [Deltaproteobacteria bacterium]|nr:hypothetical protein [Deltaproteobacteria bacterium]